MIEVKTIDGDILYINFDYKGIPEDLPIEMIETREKPTILQKEKIERAKTPTTCLANGSFPSVHQMSELFFLSAIFRRKNRVMLSG